MKLLLISTLCMLCAAVVRGNTYYFSSSTGDDQYTAAQASNPSTPWRSIDKLNSFFSQLLPGDRVVFLRGDVFYGTITVQRSGTAAEPIVFGAYGSGAKPVIQGFVAPAGWTALGNGIYEAAVPGVSVVPNLLSYNGKAYPLGRFPNADAPNGGYLNFESHVGNTQITDNELPGSVNWTGAEIVIRKNRWTTERAAITQHTGQVVQYAPVSGWDPLDRYGYFIQNSRATLDQKGEWYFDRSSNRLSVYFGSDNPAGQQIQVSNLPTLLTINQQQHLVFEGLSFQGANETAVRITNASAIQFLSCDVVFSANDAFIFNNTDNIRLSSCLVENTFNNGLTGENANNTVLRENYFHNTGIFPGMGKNEGSYEGIILKGTNNLIELNYFDQTGYIPITFNGNQTIIRQNVINHFSFIKDDGGGIYTWNNYPDKRTYYDQQITDNIILNGYGAGAGSSDPDYSAASGIYLDDNTSNVLVKGNTVANCALSGIYIHNGHELHIENNTLYNNTLQLQIRQDEAGNAPVRNNFIYNNIMLSKTGTQYVSKIESTLNDISSFGNINGNYYARPINDAFPIFTSFGQAGQIIGEVFNLPGWTLRYQFDAASKASPVTIPAYQGTGNAGPNLFVNGAFTSNISGLYCYSSTGSCQTSWNNEGKLDGGSLQYVYQPASAGATSSSYIIMDIGAVCAGKTYRVKFSALSSLAEKKTGVFLRQSQGGYQDVSPRTYITVSNNRKEYDVAFEASANEANASLVFELEEHAGFTAWFDNLQVQEATLVKTNPDDYFRFEYNGSRSTRSVALDGNYVDARNNRYSGTVSIAPFASLALIRTTESVLPVDVTAFNGNAAGDRIDLQWVTAAGETRHFDIERSANGWAFEKIGRLPFDTFKSVPRYLFADKSPLIGKNYYRIRQTDPDGMSSHTPVIMVKYLSKHTVVLSPNPARTFMEVALDVVPGFRPARLQVHDLNGVLLQQRAIAPSERRIRVNTGTLQKGSYLLRVVGDDFVVTRPFQVL